MWEHALEVVTLTPKTDDLIDSSRVFVDLNLKARLSRSFFVQHSFEEGYLRQKPDLVPTMAHNSTANLDSWLESCRC